MSLLAGFFMGFVTSMPPGPASYAILQPSMQHDRKQAWSALGGLYLADLLILLTCFFAFPILLTWSHSISLKILAGGFLILFSLRFFFTLKPVKSVFRITLLNPGVWIGTLAIFYLFSHWLSTAFLVSISMGSLAWYLTLLYLGTKIPSHWHQRVSRFALVIIGSIGLLMLLNPIYANTNSLASNCEGIQTVHESSHYECEFETERENRPLHILKLQGSYSQISYDHAYLLAEEIKSGILHETISRIRGELSEIPTPKRQIARKLMTCMRNDFEHSVSQEFQDGLKNYQAGLHDALGADQPFSNFEVGLAAYGVELAIAMAALEQKLADRPLLTLTKISAHCGIHLSLRQISEIIRWIGGGLSKFKLGCLGFAAPAQSTTTGGSLLHGRNLDADLMHTWQDRPTVYLVDEPGYYRYLATASAGTLYPGGISGMNEHQISVSLHELATTKNKTRHSRDSAELAPFLQQRILRETRTLDQAIDLIRNTSHFGAWTILITDAKTNEAAAVEFTGSKVEVAKRTRNQALGQSNHFRGLNMKKQYYTPTFNKELESRSRLAVIEEALEADKGGIDLNWAIDHLAGHEDYFEGFRSFGRTATKAYTVMSTVAKPASHEFWLTLGERRPASHSTYIGFKVDWHNFSLQPLGLKRTQQYADIPHWEQSLESFAHARMAYTRGEKELARKRLELAHEQAIQDGIVEHPYLFMKARLNHQLGDYERAIRLWDKVLKDQDRLHPYHQALALTYAAASKDAISTSRQSRYQDHLTQAYRILEDLKDEWNHPYLKKLMDLTHALYRSPRKTELPPLNFVTIE